MLQIGLKTKEKVAWLKYKQNDLFKRMDEIHRAIHNLLLVQN